MAVGFSAAEAAKIVATGSNTALDGLFLQLHIGDPGAAGTANQATETTRKALSLGAPVGGTVANDTILSWPTIAGGQQATHFSLWTLASGGTFIYSGAFASGPAYQAGDDVQIAVGAAVITLNQVAA